MKTLLKTVLVLVFTFTIATGVSAQEWTKEQKEVWQVVEKSWSDFKAWDLNGMFSSIHEKYQGWSTEDPLPSGKEKVMTWYKQMKDSLKVSGFNIEPARITVTDNAAVVDYYFTFTGTYVTQGKKEALNRHGKNVEFYVKEGGKWLLLGDLSAPEK